MYPYKIQRKRINLFFFEKKKKIKESKKFKALIIYYYLNFIKEYLLILFF